MQSPHRAQRRISLWADMAIVRKENPGTLMLHEILAAVQLCSPVISTTSRLIADESRCGSCLPWTLHILFLAWRMAGGTSSGIL